MVVDSDAEPHPHSRRRRQWDSPLTRPMTPLLAPPKEVDSTDEDPRDATASPPHHEADIINAHQAPVHEVDQSNVPSAGPGPRSSASAVSHPATSPRTVPQSPSPTAIEPSTIIALLNHNIDRPAS